jgi:hypothetical protein
MRHFNFNPTGNESLTVEFYCGECESRQPLSVDIDIPSPNFSGDTTESSQVSDSEVIDCTECGEEYEVTVYSSINGGTGEIDKIDDEAEISVTENPSSID